jgi:hypothetical protein
MIFAVVTARVLRSEGVSSKILQILSVVVFPQAHAQHRQLTHAQR